MLSTNKLEYSLQQLRKINGKITLCSSFTYENKGLYEIIVTEDNQRFYLYNCKLVDYNDYPKYYDFIASSLIVKYVPASEFWQYKDSLKNPALYEPYEPIDGDNMDNRSIDEFHERLNHIM
jgi:hypothetical protein